MEYKPNRNYSAISVNAKIFGFNISIPCVDPIT